MGLLEGRRGRTSSYIGLKYTQPPPFNVGISKDPPLPPILQRRSQVMLSGAGHLSTTYGSEYRGRSQAAWQTQPCYPKAAPHWNTHYLKDLAKRLRECPSVRLVSAPVSEARDNYRDHPAPNTPLMEHYDSLLMLRGQREQALRSVEPLISTSHTHHRPFKRSELLPPAYLSLLSPAHFHWKVPPTKAPPGVQRLPRPLASLPFAGKKSEYEDRFSAPPPPLPAPTGTQASAGRTRPSWENTAAGVRSYGAGVGSGPPGAGVGSGPPGAGVGSGPPGAGVGSGPPGAGVGSGPPGAGVGSGPPGAGVGSGPPGAGVGSGPPGAGVGSGPPGAGVGSGPPGAGVGSGPPGAGVGSGPPGAGVGSGPPGAGVGSGPPGAGVGSRPPGAGVGSRPPGAGVGGGPPGAGVGSGPPGAGVGSGPPGAGVGSGPPGAGVGSGPPGAGVGSGPPGAGVGSGPPGAGVGSGPPGAGVGSGPPGAGVGSGPPGAGLGAVKHILEVPKMYVTEQ